MSRPVVRVHARSWCRVDLAGGTLDIWPLGLLHPGARTINLAIDLPVEATVERRTAGYRVEQGEQTVEAATAEELAAHPEGALVGTAVVALDLPPMTVWLASGSPRGGGLGASSALLVAFLAAVDQLVGRPRRSAEEIAAVARDLEARLMSLPTGRQDHYPGLYGGALEILHLPGGETVRRLAVDLDELGRRLIVAYTGQSHFSAGSNWGVVRRRLDGEAESVERFAGIADVARRASAALEAAEWAELGRLVGEEWALRRRLADGITTPGIEELLRAAGAAGAWGGKACGAGGGGCLAVLAPPERRQAVAEALARAGAEVLPVQPTASRLVLSSTRRGEP